MSAVSSWQELEFWHSVALGYIYMEWSERTYDGLQRIGEERMDP